MPAPAPSWVDLFDQAKAELLLARPDLTVLPGDISEMILAAISSVGDRLAGYTAELIRATYLDGAHGEELTTLADDHWGIPRIEAVQAIGTVAFTRATTLTAGSIPAGSIVATERDANGVEIRYTTNASLSWIIGQAGPQSVAVTAEIAGRSGNVGIGKVNRVISSLFDTFTVTNTAVMAGGDEEESDTSLRSRVREYINTLQRGTLAALEFGAKQVPAVKNAVATEAGSVTTVYVTDTDGNSNLAMVSLVQIELEKWRAAGSTVNVSGGALYILTPISIALTVRSGVSIPQIVDAVKDAIVARLSKLRIGETATRAMIQQAAMNVDIDNILNVNVVSPAADVVPSASQIIRTNSAAITVV